MVSGFDSLVHEVGVPPLAEYDLDRSLTSLDLMTVERGENVAWREGMEVKLDRDVVSGQTRVDLVLGDKGSQRRPRVKCECGGDLDRKRSEKLVSLIILTCCVIAAVTGYLSGENNCCV